MVWGEISSFITARQQHAQEIERMKLQGELDAAAHQRNLEGIKLQADMGIKTIAAQAEAAAGQADLEGWLQAVKDVGKSTGIKFLDIWNGSVRPALATMALAVITFEVIKNGWVLNDWDRELVGAILGIYVADRTLTHRGK
jgi:hypothetical protein